MGVSWTDRQIDAIDVRNKNILVSAAAGSGKTAVLVERIKKLILNEGVSIDEMLVATFTNAAAGEMKEKIVKAIQAAIRENAGDKDFLKKQLNKVYKSNIGTFHSFALEVIRRYFYIINADPEFKICDEAEKAILRIESADELFSLKFESKDEKFIDFLKAYCDAKSERKAKEMVLDLHEKIQALPEPFGWLSDKTAVTGSTPGALSEYLSGFIMEDAAENLRYAVSSFQRVRAILEKAGASSLAEKSSLDIASVKEILEKIESGEFDEAVKMIGGISFSRFAAGNDEKASFEPVKDQAAKIRDKGKDCIREIKDKYFSSAFSDEAGMINATYGYMETLAGLISEFDAVYKAKKKEKALLDFNDIEHFALKILKNPDVNEEYRQKFKYIFIDEYQDCNLLQEEVVNLIKRDNNVFMVGDVKQSIYKFRLAEPEIFIRKYAAYKNAAGGKDVKIDLNTNFRCKENIINTVNEICEKIMPYDEDSALYKGVSYSGALDYPVCLHIVETRETEDEGIDPEINEMKSVEIEAGIAVNLIKGIAGKEIYEEGKGAGGNVRNVRLRDIVILMRSIKGYGEKYYQALTDAGIPAYIDDNDGYFDTIEIEVFMNLLKVIDNMRRDVPLISVLHSKIMGFSADELAMIRLKSPKTTYFRAFESYGVGGENEALSAKCRDARLRMEEWREMALFMPLDEFIWKLMWDTGYYIYAGALSGGGQRQANLRALVDKALRYMKTSSEGLYGFIRYAEILKKRGVETGQASLIGENDDVVRLLTVHKSKGLEFPVVIVCGLGRRFIAGREKSGALMHKNIGIALPHYSTEPGKHKKTLLQSVIDSRNKAEGMDEEARILYVALTRAKDMLLLSGTVKDAENAVENYKFADSGNRKAASCFMDMIAPVFIQKNLPYEVHTRGDVLSQTVKSDTFKDEFKKSLTADDGAVPAFEKEFAKKRLSYEYPEQKSLYTKSKYSVSELAQTGFSQGIEAAAAVPVFLQGKRKPSNAEIGAAFHTVMEKMDFISAARAFSESDAKGRDYLAEFLDELKRKAIIPADIAGLIDTKRIEAFLKSDIGRRAASAAKIHKETPFNIIKELDGADTIVQGIIDCYFEENGEYVLIDYKTDRVSGEDDVERIKKMYCGQAALYSEALEMIKNVKVKEKYLYLFGADTAVLID